jgi:hypothetical protein
MKTNQKLKWWIDVILFSSFIAAFFLDLTGPILHQWIGLCVCILAMYHLLMHWKWVKTIITHFFDQIASRSRLYYLIDVTMLIGFSIILGTGLVISSWLNLYLTHYTGWWSLHVIASIVTLLVTILKIGLHWRWIVATPRLQTAYPSVHKTEIRRDIYTINRREFLKVMGVTTAVGLIALNKSIQSLQESAASAITQSVKVNSTIEPEIGNDTEVTRELEVKSNTVTTEEPIIADNQDTRANFLALSQSADLCTQRCRRGCSYPGHCRRYADLNNNGYCDSGECL